MDNFFLFFGFLGTLVIVVGGVVEMLQPPIILDEWSEEINITSDFILENCTYEGGSSYACTLSRSCVCDSVEDIKENGGRCECSWGVL